MRFARFLCYALPMAAPIWVNVEAAHVKGAPWTIAAITSVAFSAIFLEYAFITRWPRSIAYGFLALFLTICNVGNAIGNAGQHSEDGRELRSSQQEEARKAVERRSQWSQARAEMAAIAGNATPASVEAEINALKISNAQLWDASFKCDPGWISKERTKEFCASVEKLKAKKAAAERRDALDKDIEALDAKTEGKASPESLDPFADNVAAALELFGYTVDAKGKVKIATAKDWSISAGMELVGTFGPSALLAMFFGLRREGETEVKAEPIKAVRKPEAEVGLEPALELEDPEMDGFIGRRLEFVQGEHIPSAAMFAAWREDCERRGVKPGSQRTLCQRLKRRVEHSPSNGRPRFVGVRLKSADHAPLRLAVSNA